MDPVTPFDWHRLFFGTEPPLYLLEVLFRVVAIYLFAVLLLRLVGKRGNGNLSPFETVVIIALGSATGDAMFYPEVPILYAWVVIAAIVLLNRSLAWAQRRSEPVNAFLEGRPLMLIQDGRVLPAALRQARLREDEFFGMLRERDVTHTGEIRHAFLERSGKLGLDRFDEADRRAGTPTFPARLERPG